MGNIAGMNDSLISENGMTNRDWFCLALRVMGVWQLSSTAAYLGYIAAALVSDASFDAVSSPLVYLIWIGATAAAGLALLLFAPAIAIRLYPEQKPQVDAKPGLDAFEVGLRLLGVYFIVQAVHNAANGVGRAIAMATLSGSGALSNVWTQSLNGLVSGGVLLALGLIVLLGPKRIAAAVDRLRYKAERDAYVPPPVKE